MRKKGNKAWVWLVGALLASSLNLGCASVQTGGAAKEEEKPIVELADANAKEGSFWKDEEVIMKLGEKQMTYADLKSDFKTNWAKGDAELTMMTKDQQVKFFRKYFYEKLFATEARARGLENSQNYLDHTLAKRYRILVLTYKAVEVAEKVKPTEEYLMMWIPPAEDEVQLQVIVKKDIADARKVYERARAGEDFEKLWESENEGLQRQGQGLSPWLSPHNPQKYPPPVIERLLKVEVGTVEEPFYMDIGFLVVKVAGKRSAEELRRRELEKRRDQLIFDYQKNHYEEKTKSLNEAAKVDLKNEAIDRFVNGEGRPSDIVVEIDGKGFPASEALEEMVEAEHSGQPIVQRLRGFIEAVVIGREAVRLGLDKHPYFLARWGIEEDRALSRELSRVTVAEAEKMPITDEDLVSYVKANPDKFLLPESRQISAIMSPTLEGALASVARLDKGEDFAKVAAEMSSFPKAAENGGELGWAEKRDLPQPFQEPIFTLKEGEHTKAPVEAMSASEEPVWFTFKVTTVRKPSPAPLDRVNLRSAEPKVLAFRRTKSLENLASEISAKHGYKICIGLETE